MRLRAIVAIAAAAGIATATGCATAPHGRPAEASAFEVLASRSPDVDTTLPARDLEPTAPSASTWLMVEKQRQFEVRYEAAGDATARTDASGTRMLESAPDGTVSIRSQTDASDGAQTIFAPPLLLAPPLLRAGEERTAESRLTTQRAGVSGDDAGSARRTVAIAAIDRIRTPLGEFDAIRVDSELVMKLPFASLSRRSSVWVRAGTGPVAARSDERILVMGIVPRNTAETRVRLPGGGRP